LAAITLTGLVTLPGCGSAGLADSAIGANDEFGEPRRLLAQHKIDDARAEYRQLLFDTEQGHAAAGMAITETLLVLEREPVDQLLTTHLGADNQLDVTRAIYANKGYFYWWSRGTPWSGDGDRPGIRDLIASRLPWSADELSSLGQFTDGLTQPTGEVRDDLAALAESLTDIETYIDTALDDPDFDGIYLPGEVFHDDDLSMTLRRSELAALGATVATTRAAIHAVRAYEHPWSLEDAFGPQWEQEAANNPPERQGWTAWDYSMDFLATRLAKIKSAPEPRQQMRRALKDGLRWADRAIELGLQHPDSPSRLSWHLVDESYARDLRDLLVAARHGLTESTPLPTSSPETSMYYDSFFSEGRTLPGEARWWSPNPIRADSSDPDSEVLYIEWPWNDQTLQRVFVDGFFEPAIDITDDSSDNSRIQALDELPNFWDTLLTRDATYTNPP
jgi:hypothetical protein